MQLNNYNEKKLVFYACLILGPLIMIAGVLVLLENHQYSSQGALVKAEVIDSEIIKSSRGRNRVKFRVNLLFDDDRSPVESFFIVYESQAHSVMNTNPLEVLYLVDSPRTVQLPKDQRDGWMPVIVGLLMSIWAIRHLINTARLNQELKQLQDSIPRN